MNIKILILIFLMSHFVYQSIVVESAMRLYGLAVDTGYISIIDKGYIIKNGGIIDKNLVEEIDLEPGIYEVEYSLPWDDKRTVRVNVKSGTLIIGDAAYSFPDNAWDKFLNKTKFLSDMNGSGYAVDTGGDGGFDIELDFKKVLMP